MTFHDTSKKFKQAEEPLIPEREKPLEKKKYFHTQDLEEAGALGTTGDSCFATGATFLFAVGENNVFGGGSNLLFDRGASVGRLR